MICDVIERSLRQPNRLIPVEALLGNCDGSRMPDVIADRLTPAIAQRLVEVCPTAAFRIEEHDGRPCLRLSYGDCIGCGKCFEASEGAVVAAKSFAWCGRAKDQLVRIWDIESRAEITPPHPESRSCARADSIPLWKGPEYSPIGCRFVQRVRGGNHRPHQSLLRPGTIRNSFRRVSKTCRYASGHRPSHSQHGRSRKSHVRGRPMRRNW